MPVNSAKRAGPGKPDQARAPLHGAALAQGVAPIVLQVFVLLLFVILVILIIVLVPHLQAAILGTLLAAGSQLHSLS
jgi:hypothetical protein